VISHVDISVDITSLQVLDYKGNGGEGGIRTPGTLSGTPVFKTGAINHSATSPAELTLRTLTKTAASRVRSLHHAEISVLRQQSECLGVKLHNFGEMRQEIRHAVIAGIRVVFMSDALSYKFGVQSGRAFFKAIVVLLPAI
jgi:hypothetical protein